jgi:hypothetical protein
MQGQTGGTGKDRGMGQEETNTKKAIFYISFIDIQGNLTRHKGPFYDRYMAQMEANMAQEKTNRMVTVEEAKRDD